MFYQGYYYIQQMCQHSRKAKVFCLSEECTHSSCFGCGECVRRLHKGGKEWWVGEEEVLQAMKLYQVPAQVKDERKDTIYKVYQVLNSIKNEIYDHIDNHFNTILSKIKYPFLYHQHVLQTYRLVRDKNYHKMDHSKLIAFWKTSKAITNQEFLAKEIQYYEDYLKETHSSLQALTHQVNAIQNAFGFSVSKESLALHKQLLAELSSAISKPAALDVKQLSGSKVTPKSWTSLKEEALDQKETKPLKSVQREGNSNLDSSLRLQLPKARLQGFLTPKKEEKDLDLSLQKVPSILLSEESEAKTTHIQERENIPNASIVSLVENTSILARNQRKKEEAKKGKEQPEKEKEVGDIIRAYNQSNTDSIFIKISEAHPNEKGAENSQSKLTKSTITQDKGIALPVGSNSTIAHRLSEGDRFRQRKEAAIKQKEESVKKRLHDLAKANEQDKKEEAISNNINNRSASNINDIVSLKAKLQPKPSYFLNVTAKRKGSRHQSELNDSLGKEVFEFAREEKPKIISRSIKKEIPHVELVNSVKTEPVPKNSSFLGQGQQSTQQREVQMAAIFMSGINQPVVDNKICFLEKYIQKYEGNLTAVELLTYLYLQKGKYKECLSLSTKYLNLLGQSPSSRTTLIVNKTGALNNLGRYSQAIKILEEYLKVQENDKLHKNMGDAYYSINVLDKATYHYEKAIQVNSHLDEAFFNLAVILYRQESFFNAKMNIEKALAINKAEEHYLQLHSHIQERISMNSNRVTQ